MSDHEVTQLGAILRRLQYQQAISASSFKTPNFALVADLLQFMVQRLDPTSSISHKIATEDDRVRFVSDIALTLAKSMNISIDRKNVYAADGRAVHELLKVASVLDRAMSLADEDVSTSSEMEIQPSAILTAVYRAKSLVGEIVTIGSRLSDVLENESNDGKERSVALSVLNSSSEDTNEGSQRDHHIDSSLARLLESTNETVKRLDKQCKLLISNQRGMEEKIRKKTIDLERTAKRLESLKNVRPAYMDEYEKLEEEIQVEHERYVVRLRNVDYLKQELAIIKQAANERHAKVERSMKRMQKKFRDEEMLVLKGRDDVINEEIIDSVDDRLDKGLRANISVTNSTPGNENVGSLSFASNGEEQSSDESGIEITGSPIPEDGSDSDDSNF
jgi:clusterin-associated protein 1